MPVANWPTMYGCPSRRASHPPLWAATRISADAPTKRVINASGLSASALDASGLEAIPEFNGSPP